MAYIIGQGLGILATLFCFICPLWKKKWQMCITVAAANLLVALNFVLIGQIGSAFVMNLVAVAQSMLSLVRTVKETKVTRIEKIVFLILYVSLGFAGIVLAPGFTTMFSMKFLLELLPILGAVLLMISIFVRDEQATRLYALANAVVWTVYDSIIGTTAVLAQIISIITTSYSLYQNRKKD